MKKKFKRNAKAVLEGIGTVFRLGSIQSIIAFSFILITIPVMIFTGLVLYNKFTTISEKNALIGSSQTMEQVKINLDYYLKGMIDVSDSMSDENGIINLEGEDKISDVFRLSLKLRKDIVALAIFTDKGELVAASTANSLKNGIDIAEEEWFKNLNKDKLPLYFSSPHVQNLFRSKHKWVVSLSKQISYKQKDELKKGISLVDMNFSTIEELCHNIKLGKRGYVYIVDNKGNIIYHPQQQMIYAGLKSENIDLALDREEGSYVDNYNGEQRLMSIKEVKDTGWKLVGISYYSEMITSRNDILYFLVIILVSGIILVCLISILISQRISRPIKRLDKIMNKVEKGEFEIYAEIKGDDEVRRLSHSFNLMISRIRQLMEQIIEEQEEKRKSELKALQAQINPHFLYNTLDSVVWMAENDESQGVITMVTALANLFRISISRGKETITIGDELEHAKSYLTIQQIRYGEKFDFVIEAQQEALNCKCLKIILQPIIENSIYHGIKPMVDRGLIKITAELVNDRVCLQVIDNGLGMSREKAEEILKKSPKELKGSGIGVKNVDERIKLYFGGDYGLKIESEIDEGTCVKLWLPRNIT